jgi:hypothetical protein
VVGLRRGLEEVPIHGAAHTIALSTALRA